MSIGNQKYLKINMHRYYIDILYTITNQYIILNILLLIRIIIDSISYISIYILYILYILCYVL